MLMLAPRFVFVYPGIGLVVSGGGMMLALTRGPLSVWGSIFDVHTLLCASVMLMIGF